jgi:hypothetical protein
MKILMHWYRWIQYLHLHTLGIKDGSLIEFNEESHVMTLVTNWKYKEDYLGQDHGEADNIDSDDGQHLVTTFSFATFYLLSLLS